MEMKHQGAALMFFSLAGTLAGQNGGSELTNLTPTPLQLVRFLEAFSPLQGASLRRIVSFVSFPWDS